MEVRRYKGRYPEAIEKLRERGLLLRGVYPVQKPVYLILKEGVDITIRFQRMDPSHFAKNASLILKAAFEEASRYEDVPKSYKFAEFKVDIWDTTKHKRPLQRDFTTAYNPDSEVMVYGATGWEPDTFLTGKVDSILDIPNRYKDKMRSPTYRVKSLRIGIRIPKGAAIKEVEEAAV